jgi:hypothetical protein
LHPRPTWPPIPIISPSNPKVTRPTSEDGGWGVDGLLQTFQSHEACPFRPWCGQTPWGQSWAPPENPPTTPRIAPTSSRPGTDHRAMPSLHDDKRTSKPRSPCKAKGTRPQSRSLFPDVFRSGPPASRPEAANKTFPLPSTTLEPLLPGAAKQRAGAKQKTAGAANS